MKISSQEITTELRMEFAQLGVGGGRISPSIYDTAQLLRLYPPRQGRDALINWLLCQQHGDGGWGNPAAPLARDVPTWATLIALNDYCQDCRVQQATAAGLRFLEVQQAHWATVAIDELPIATEMTLPHLTAAAQAKGFPVAHAAYQPIYQIQAQKQQLINGRALRPGSPPTYSWEALSSDVAHVRPDDSGGIGHSPAATAAWLRHAEQDPALSNECRSARAYLENAAAATGVGIPGVVPNVWPITGFELAYAPYILLATDLLQLPALQDLAPPLLDELWRIFRRGNGVSFGEYFTPDVDDTGLAVALLSAHGREVDLATIYQFQRDEYFSTFHQELNPSVLANAHALFGLSHAGTRCGPVEEFLCARQQADGRWLADKLHSSWLYTTLEAVTALNQLGYRPQVQRAARALVDHQQADGSWGTQGAGSRLETSYALLTLAILQPRGLLDAAAVAALRNGHRWLSEQWQVAALPDAWLWIGKELYSPYRVDRIYELSALLCAMPEWSAP